MNRRIHAPTTALPTAVSHHGPRVGKCSVVHSQPPMKAPITPMTMSPIKPKPPPIILPASQPATRPIIMMTTILLVSIMTPIPPQHGAARSAAQWQPCRIFNRKNVDSTMGLANLKSGHCDVGWVMVGLGHKGALELFNQSPRLRAAGAGEGSRQRFKLFEL